MKQKSKKQLRRLRRKVNRRKGTDPSVVSKKKKFVFNTSISHFHRVYHQVVGSPDPGLPETNDDAYAGVGNGDGGIRVFTFAWNDLLSPFPDVPTKQADGFANVEQDYSMFYTIGGKATFAFDMREVAAYKLYMISTHTNNIWSATDITPNFTTAGNAEITRKKLQNYLDEKADKTNMSSHWLQRGDGYNSVGTISLKYSPRKFDPDRGPILDDENNDYATKGGKYRPVIPGPTIGLADSPNNLDYCHVIFLPVARSYMQAYMANPAGSPNLAAMVWGKLFLQQIAVGVNTEASLEAYKDVDADIEVDGKRQFSATNPVATV